MIKAENLCKRFDKKIVYEKADFTVETGSVCGLIGINGAGKSTLLRMLSGVFEPDEGTLTIDGQPVYDNAAVKKDIFFLPDEPYFDGNFNLAKLKELYSTFYDFDGAVYDAYIQQFNLPKTKPLRNYSKGMRRQAFVSAAFACKTKYLFMDETFDGLDPLRRMELKRGIIKRKEEGVTVIIASHSLRELEDICDSFILIDNQTVSHCGALLDALDGIFKLQFAVSDEFDTEDIPFTVMRVNRVGKVITVVGKGDKQEAIEKLKELNPVFVEEVPMDFEDMFIEEVQNRGYLK